MLGGFCEDRDGRVLFGPWHVVAIRNTVDGTELD